MLSLLLKPARHFVLLYNASIHNSITSPSSTNKRQDIALSIISVKLSLILNSVNVVNSFLNGVGSLDLYSYIYKWASINANWYNLVTLGSESIKFNLIVGECKTIEGLLCRHILNKVI